MIEAKLKTTENKSQKWENIKPWVISSDSDMTTEEVAKMYLPYLRAKNNQKEEFSAWVSPYKAFELRLNYAGSLQGHYYRV